MRTTASFPLPSSSLAHGRRHCDLLSRLGWLKSKDEQNDTDDNFEDMCRTGPVQKREPPARGPQREARSSPTTTTTTTHTHTHTHTRQTHTHAQWVRAAWTDGCSSASRRGAAARIVNLILRPPGTHGREQRQGGLPEIRESTLRRKDRRILNNVKLQLLTVE